MAGYFLAPRIAFGTPALEELRSLGAQRPWILMDASLRAAPLRTRIAEELEQGGAKPQFGSEVRAEPTLASVAGARGELEAARPDWIVAVGGGSTIDTAKAAWVGYARPDLPLESVNPLSELSLRAHSHFAVFPSTVGSGSECTGSAVLRGESGRLIEITSRELVPDWVFLQPELPALLPPALVASTAGDALAHAFESVLSEWASPLSDAVALEAMAVIFRELSRAVRHPDEAEPRERLQQAAALAGLASANSQLGLGHALAYAAGPRLGLAHAKVAATLLPYCLEFNFPASRARMSVLERVVGAGAVQSGNALAQRIRILWESVGLPRSLGSAGATQELFRREAPAIVEAASRSPHLLSNPRIPSGAELGTLLETAFTGSALPPAVRA